MKVQSVGAFTFGILAQIPPDPENPGFPAYRVYPLIHPFTTTPDELSVGFIRLFSHSFSKWHCGVNLRSCLFSPLFFLPLFVSLSFFLLFLPLSFRLWFEYMSERERERGREQLVVAPAPSPRLICTCVLVRFLQLVQQSDCGPHPPQTTICSCATCVRGSKGRSIYLRGLSFSLCDPLAPGSLSSLFSCQIFLDGTVLSLCPLEKQLCPCPVSEILPHRLYNIHPCVISALLSWQPRACVSFPAAALYSCLEPLFSCVVCVTLRTGSPWQSFVPC